MIKRFTESKCAADTEEPEEAANTRESRKRPRVGAGPINNTLEDQGHPVGRVEKKQQRNIKLKVLKKLFIEENLLWHLSMWSKNQIQINEFNWGGVASIDLYLKKIDQ